MSSRTRSILVYLAALGLLTIAIRLVWNESFLETLRRLSWTAIAGSVLWAQLVFFISGNQYSLMCRSLSGRSMNWREKLWMPVAVNLWSYLIPIQGGTFYSMYFFRKTYGIRASNALSLSLVLYLMTIFLSGVTGLVVVSTHPGARPELWVASIACILFPLTVPLARRLFASLRPPSPGGLLHRGHEFTATLIASLQKLVIEPRSAARLLGQNLAHIAASGGWYWWIAHQLDLPVSPSQAIMLILVMRLSLVFRFTPGNLGTEQLISAGVLAAIGARAQDGVAISIVANASCYVLIFLAGIPFTWTHLRQVWSASRAPTPSP